MFQLFDKEYKTAKEQNEFPSRLTRRIFQNFNFYNFFKLINFMKYRFSNHKTILIGFQTLFSDEITTSNIENLDELLLDG